MSRRSLFDKSKGQSIPLIALIMVVLFGMVGLSVDVGNTYAQQRDIVRSTNAAALAAMEVVLRSEDTSLANDASVGSAILNSFESNGIKISDFQPTDPNGNVNLDDDVKVGDIYIRSRYLGPDGKELVDCNIGQCTNVPKNVTYVHVSAQGLVGTYFARVVGQDTLPINTKSYVGKCLPSDTVFPIAIYDEYLDGNAFANPGDGSHFAANGFVSEQHPTGKPVRRLHIKPNVGDANSFSFLKWKNDSDLGTMLRGVGNVSEGVEEIPDWPSDSVAPDGYPLNPGELSPNDWLYGIEGWPASSNIEFALNEHLTSRTPMYLPIVSEGLTTGAGPAYRVNRIGVFYLVGMGNGYLDLAYTGDAKGVPCPHDVPTGTQGLEGIVYVKPNSSANDQIRPIAYQIVLDTSGSMSWDFAGHGSKGGSHQCEDANNPGSAHPYRGDCQGGNDSAWNAVEERRIYVAKQAILDLINGMNEDDIMQVIAYSSGNSAIGGANAKAYPADGMTGDKAELEAAVMSAGDWGQGEYNTVGGTPGAQAMRLTGQLLEKAPDKASDGREYRDVVIYLTDGVANVFLDGSRDMPTGAGEVCEGMPNNKALNTYTCQVGYTPDNTPRPVTALIAEANKIKINNNGMSLFVVAMGPASNGGLQEVATQSNMLYSADEPGVVKGIFQAIKSQVENGDCRTDVGTYVSSIAGHEVPGGLPPRFGTEANVHGYVTIGDTTGAEQYRVPIVVDNATGNLVYRIPAEPGIPAGTYTMRAFLNYNGNDDVARTYERITSNVDPEGTTQISFSVPKGSFGVVHDGPRLFLDLVNDSVCPVQDVP